MQKLFYRNLLKAAREADQRPAIKSLLTAPSDHFDTTTRKWTPTLHEDIAGEKFADSQVTEFCSARYGPTNSLYDFVRDQYRNYRMIGTNKEFLFNCLRRIHAAREIEQEFCDRPFQSKPSFHLRPNALCSYNDINSGALLIAHPTQTFRPYRQSVVLMLKRHYGILLNYPICHPQNGIMTLGEVAQNADPRLTPLLDVPAYLGGSVLEHNFVLHPYKEIYLRKPSEPTLQKPLFDQDGWYLSEMTSDVLERLSRLKTQRNFVEDGVKVFLGKLYWHPGQLRGELHRHIWFSIRRTPSLSDLYTDYPLPVARSAPSSPQTPDTEANSVRVQRVESADLDDRLNHHMWAMLMRSLGGEFGDFARIRPMNDEVGDRLMYKLRLYEAGKAPVEVKEKVAIEA